MEVLPENYGVVSGKKMTKRTYEKLVQAWRRSNNICIKLFGLPELDSKTAYYPYPERGADGHIHQRIKKTPIPDFEELV